MSTDRFEPNLVETVGRIARTMRDQGGSGPLSAGEAIAGALLNNRMDWLPPMYSHPIDAFERLGPEWWSAIVVAHQQGWDSTEV
ncbi:hypothetical protein [Methylobacterium sp. sgz302541]|uniref:hypothetical protein n=1 Tax=unclassified Methylobacterium TaxID=2615210 RepID=UPI003D34DF24